MGNFISDGQGAPLCRWASMHFLQKERLSHVIFYSLQPSQWYTSFEKPLKILISGKEGLEVSKANRVIDFNISLHKKINQVLICYKSSYRNAKPPSNPRYRLKHPVDREYFNWQSSKYSKYHWTATSLCCIWILTQYHIYEYNKERNLKKNVLRTPKRLPVPELLKLLTNFLYSEF